MSSKVKNLLESLKKNNLQTPSGLDKQIMELEHPRGKIEIPESRAKQQSTLRRVNYEQVQSNMDRWLPIVKLNREKGHLNFTQKVNNHVRVNFFPSSVQDPLTAKIQTQLQKLNAGSQKQLVESEQKVLEKLAPQEARERMREMRKQRSLIFYEEMRRKRVSKIKSKLYHRIKKRQRMKAEAQKMAAMDPEQKQVELQKMRSKRAQQRLSLRHKTKSKHIRDMMRFSKGNKNHIQQSINEINRLRKEQLERLDEEVVKQISEEYDEQNFREQAMQQLEEEVQLIEDMQGNKSALTGLKFMDKALLSKLNDDKKQAYRLMGKLARNEMEIEQEGDPADTPEQNAEDEQLVRKKYSKPNQKQSKDELKPKPQNLNRILDNYLLTSTGKEKNLPTKVQDLVKNIETDKLRQKYQPKRVNEIDIQKFIDENQQLFQNIAVAENLQDFQQNKLQEYEQADPQPKTKEVKGWGSWTGPGIAQKPKDPKKQLADKLKRIEEMKKTRKDGANSNVIIHQYRNKQFASEYLVQKLPHNYNTTQQFEFTHGNQLGPEWNSMKDFKQAIKPKIITKVGEVIQPIKLPKKLSKYKN